MHAKVSFTEAANCFFRLDLSRQEAVMGNNITFNVIICNLLIKALCQDTCPAQILVNSGGRHFCLVDRIDNILRTAVGVSADKNTGH